MENQYQNQLVIKNELQAKQFMKVPTILFVIGGVLFLITWLYKVFAETGQLFRQPPQEMPWNIIVILTFVTVVALFSIALLKKSIIVIKVAIVLASIFTGSFFWVFVLTLSPTSMYSNLVEAPILYFLFFGTWMTLLIAMFIYFVALQKSNFQNQKIVQTNLPIFILSIVLFYIGLVTVLYFSIGSRLAIIDNLSSSINSMSLDVINSKIKLRNTEVSIGDYYTGMKNFAQIMMVVQVVSYIIAGIIFMISTIQKNKIVAWLMTTVTTMLLSYHIFFFVDYVIYLICINKINQLFADQITLFSILSTLGCLVALVGCYLYVASFKEVFSKSVN